MRYVLGGCPTEFIRMALISPGSKPRPTNQEEINERQSTAGTSLSWDLSTFAELHISVRNLGSKRASFLRCGAL